MNQITISKELKSHWIFQNEKYFKWWMLMLIEANDEDTVYLYKNELLKVKKGQIMKPLSSWAELFNCHIKTVKKFFLLLEINDMICTRKNPKRALQPTLIEIRLSGCFIQKRAEQNAIQSAIQNDPIKLTKKEPLPEPFTPLDDSFKLQEPEKITVKKRKPITKKKVIPDAAYSKCVDIYYEFFKGRNDGREPKFNGVSGAKLKSIIKHLERVVIAKTPTAKDNQQELDKMVVESFQYIFVNWNKLDDFWQQHTDLSTIDSKFDTILNQIKRNGKSKQTSSNDNYNRTTNVSQDYMEKVLRDLYD